MKEWIKELVCQPLVHYYTIRLNEMDFETDKEVMTRYIKQIEALMNFVDGIRTAGVN